MVVYILPLPFVLQHFDEVQNQTDSSDDVPDFVDCDAKSPIRQKLVEGIFPKPQPKPVVIDSDEWFKP